jgi:hypothetical protein
MASHPLHPSQATTNRPGHPIPVGQGHVPDTAFEILAFNGEMQRLAEMAPALVNDLDHLITLMSPHGDLKELDILESGATFFHSLRHNLVDVLDDVKASIDVYIHFRIHNGPGLSPRILRHSVSLGCNRIVDGGPVGCSRRKIGGENTNKCLYASYLLAETPPRKAFADSHPPQLERGAGRFGKSHGPTR